MNCYLVRRILTFARAAPGQLDIKPLFEIVDLGDVSGLRGLDLVNVPLLIARFLVESRRPHLKVEHHSVVFRV